MSVRISADQLSATVIKALSEYQGYTNEVLEHAAQTAGKHAVAELQTGSPSAGGDYAKGWKLKKGSYSRIGGIRSVIIHNPKRYMLTHLLENGHRKVVWGHRTGGTVSAKVHIAPVESEVVKEFEDLVLKGIGKY